MCTFPPSFSTHCTYDAPVPSTEATTKSKFRATAHVEYTQSGSTDITTSTTIEVRNGCRRRSDTFRESAEQRVGITISADTSSAPCARTGTYTRATPAKARALGDCSSAGPYYSSNLVPKSDADLDVEPVSVLNVCVRSAARWLIWLTIGVRGRITS